MALDGITVAGIVSELNKKLLGGRIDKIYQPLADEIISEKMLLPQWIISVFCVNIFVLIDGCVSLYYF